MVPSRHLLKARSGRCFGGSGRVVRVGGFRVLVLRCRVQPTAAGVGFCVKLNTNGMRRKHRLRRCFGHLGPGYAVKSR